jgi:hypothetical protein
MPPLSGGRGLGRKPPRSKRQRVKRRALTCEATASFHEKADFVKADVAANYIAPPIHLAPLPFALVVSHRWLGARWGSSWSLVLLSRRRSQRILARIAVTKTRRIVGVNVARSFLCKYLGGASHF